jgi:hypothetical protein
VSAIFAGQGGTDDVVAGLEVGVGYDHRGGGLAVASAADDQGEVVATGAVKRIGRNRPPDFVNHTAGEYVRGEVHACTIDSFWSLKEPAPVSLHPADASMMRCVHCYG